MLQLTAVLAPGLPMLHLSRAARSALTILMLPAAGGRAVLQRPGRALHLDEGRGGTLRQQGECSGQRAAGRCMMSAQVQVLSDRTYVLPAKGIQSSGIILVPLLPVCCQQCDGQRAAG